MSRMLAEMRHIVTCIDLSEKMLSVAKAKMPACADFRVDDADNPLFGVGTFDVVVAIQKKHMPLRYKISYKYDYYMVIGSG